MSGAYEKVRKVEGKISRDSHTERVNKAVGRIKKLDDQLLPSQQLNPRRAQVGRDRFSKLGTNSGLGNLDPSEYPIDAHLQGRYIRPDPRDTDMEIRRNLLKKRDGFTTEFGQMMAGPEVIDYLKDKKEQETYKNQLELASYLIDPRDPRTQEEAYKHFPELLNYPEEAFNQNVGVQMALRGILRDGKLRGAKDNALIYKICSKGYELPLYPVWDHDGALLGNTEITRDLAKMQADAIKRGIFNPRRYAAGSDENLPMQTLQKKLKLLILRRVYPGLRYKPEGSEELEAVWERVSSVESPYEGKGTPTEDKIWGSLKEIKALPGKP